MQHGRHDLNCYFGLLQHLVNSFFRHKKGQKVLKYFLKVLIACSVKKLSEKKVGCSRISRITVHIFFKLTILLRQTLKRTETRLRANLVTWPSSPRWRTLWTQFVLTEIFQPNAKCESTIKIQKIKRRRRNQGSPSWKYLGEKIGQS